MLPKFWVLETSEVVEMPLLKMQNLKLNVRNWLQCKLCCFSTCALCWTWSTGCLSERRGRLEVEEEEEMQLAVSSVGHLGELSIWSRKELLSELKVKMEQRGDLKKMIEYLRYRFIGEAVLCLSRSGSSLAPSQLLQAALTLAKRPDS